jgi:hypothetical protein
MRSRDPGRDHGGEGCRQAIAAAHVSAQRCTARVEDPTAGKRAKAWGAAPRRRHCACNSSRSCQSAIRLRRNKAATGPRRDDAPRELSLRGSRRGEVAIALQQSASWKRNACALGTREALERSSRGAPSPSLLERGRQPDRG